MHQGGEGEGAAEAQVQEGVQGRAEGDQEGLALPGQREAEGGHGQVGMRRRWRAKKCLCEMFPQVENSKLFPRCRLLFFFFFRDAERKKKVKELFGSLASQEGEWKALKRKKRK